MYLYINTATKNRLNVSLIKNGELVDYLDKKTSYHDSEKLLGLIDALLKQNRKTVKNLTGIIVIKGPGSFTAVRIGVTVANTLAWSLKVPVFGYKLDQPIDFTKIYSQKKIKLVEPFYDKSPNISKSKKSWK